jgi:hypothetical protein
MGGIVARYMLEKHREAFADKRVGLVLIASPSYGSKHANTLDLLLRLYDHGAGKQLKWGNWSLSDLDDRFRDVVNKKGIPGLCGIELYENHFIVPRWLPFLRWKWTPSRNKTVVVAKESAGRYFGAPKQMRATDHFSIVKPDTVEHPTHRALLSFLLDNDLLSEGNGRTVFTSE